ncbi:MAG: hypothetical protein WCU88_09880 [Elusimicrobiota bacterium]|jgi:hypothetical protein
MRDIFVDPKGEWFAVVLFFAFSLSVPTLGFYLIAAGSVPLWVYIWAMTLGDMAGFFIGGAHLLLWGTLLYGVALLLARGIFIIIRPPVARFITLIAILTGLSMLALSPVYYPISHSRSEWTDMRGLIRHGL